MKGITMKIETIQPKIMVKGYELPIKKAKKHINLKDKR